MKPINPQDIAYKLAAAANCFTPNFAAQLKAAPRLAEVLWLLQWHSCQPGGLGQFAKTLIDAFPERIGTPALLRNGQKPFTPATRHDATEEIPSGMPGYQHRSGNGDPADVVAFTFWESVQEGRFLEQKINQAAFSKVTPASLFALCRKAADADLAHALNRFCSLPDEPENLIEAHTKDDTASKRINGEDRPLPDLWYFQDIQCALIAMLDIQAAQAAKGHAQTQAAAKVFDGLDYALAHNGMVRIEGQTRFGKTHACETYCKMYPGRARLVRTPSNATEFDLLTAIADAFGLPVTLATRQRELKRAVEFIIKHGRLMIILDEAHFIFPPSPRRFTSPTRLNWIRTRIVDNRCPLALVTTPQEFLFAVKKIVEGAGHNIDQFLGRAILTVQLPEPSDDDLMAVARFHFPEISDTVLQMIVGKAMRAEGYISAIQGMAARAAYLAKKAGREKITLEDVRQAANEFMPSVQAPAPVAVAPALQLRRAAPAQSVKPNRNMRPATAPAADLKTPARSVTPESQLA